MEITMVGIEQIMLNLQSGGMKLVLPFLLVFVILYGVLNMVSLFGDDKIDAALSIIISIIVIGYTPFVEGVFYGYLTNVFGGVSLLLLSLLAFYMLAGFLLPGKGNIKDMMADQKGWLVLAAALIILLLSLNYGIMDYLFGMGSFDLDMATLMPYILIGAVIGFIIWVINGTSPENTHNSSGSSGDGDS